MTFQDQMILVLITGILTLSGVIITAIINILKDRWIYNRGKEERTNNLKANFYSPLLFHIQKIVSNLGEYSVNLLHMEHLDITQKCKFAISKIKEEIVIVEKLLEANLLDLPPHLGIDISGYTNLLTLYINLYHELIEPVFSKKNPPVEYINNVCIFPSVFKEIGIKIGRVLRRLSLDEIITDEIIIIPELYDKIIDSNENLVKILEEWSSKTT